MIKSRETALYDVPVEIINAIVDLVACSGDTQKQDLKALSQSCTIFLSSCRYHLFYQSTFFLAPDDIDGKIRSTLYLLDDSPHLAKYIRSLRITKPSEGQLKPKDMLSTSYKVQKHESALASFLSLLKNLQELYVQSLTFIVFPSRQLNKAILALKSCLLKNPIQSLHVDDVFTFPMDILHLLPLVRLSLKDVKVSDHFPQPELKYVPHSLPQSLRSLKIHAYVGQTAVRSWIADKELPGRGTITSLTIPSMDFGVGKRVLLLYANTLTALTVEGIDGYGEQLDLSLLPELRTLDLNIDSRESHPDSSWVLWLGSVVRTVDASRFTEGHLKVRVFNDTTEVQYDTLKPEVEQFEAFFWNAPSLFVYSDSDDSPFDYEDDEDEIEIFDTEELEDDEFEEDDYEEDEEEDEYE